MEAKNVAETKTSSAKTAEGIFLSLLSAITVSFSAEFVALARKDGLPSFQIVFLMRLTELLGVMCVAAFYRPRFTGENRHQNFMLFLFVILSNIVIIAKFLSFTYTVPGIAFGIIQGSMPLFVACVGFLFLKEALILVDACAILISVTGVVLVAVGMTQIGAMSTELLVLSISIPLLASLVFAPDIVIMRYLTGTLGVSIVTALLYSDLLGTVVLLVITYAAEIPIWTMPSRTVFYVVGVGVTKLIAALTFFASLKVVKAYISIAVRMFIIPITLLLDYLFMHEFPNQLQVAGVVLVTLGIVIVSVHTWRTHRMKERQRELLETLHFDHEEE